MSDISQPFYEDHIGIIGEMGSLDSMTDGMTVPPDFLESVRANDDDPLFVTVEIESGMSASKRNWKPEHVTKTVDAVNQRRMSGNLGHPLLKKDAYETEFPTPQVVWVAAKAREAGGKMVGKFKGYVLKTAAAREYLKLGLIDGVSWFGDTTMKPLPGGGYDVISFEPETIDFARKGRSGMKSRIVALAGEMGTEGGWTVEPREIAALSVDEVKTHAPLLFGAIQTEATAPLETKVGEQATALTAAEAEIDLATQVRKLLGVSEGENPIEKLTSLIQTVEDSAKDGIKEFVQSLVGKKVKTPRGQAVLNRLLGEMHTEYEGPLTDELKTQIEGDFTKKTEEDESVKALIGEMSGWDDTEDNKDKDKDTTKTGGGTHVGGKTRVGEMRGRDNEDLSGAGGVVRKTGNLTVRKVKFGS